MYVNNIHFFRDRRGRREAFGFATEQIAKKKTFRRMHVFKINKEL